MSNSAFRDYESCYAVLGVTPGSDWATVRAQYRRLIGRWHPDRFADSPATRKSAEDHSKRITAAYQALGRYRREHGTLPFPALAPAARPAPDQRGRHADRWWYSLKIGGRFANDADRTDESGRLRERRRRIMVVVGLLAAILYLGYEGMPMAPDDRIASRLVHEPPASRPPRNEEMMSGTQGILSIGSTVGEVVTIQGIPTSTTGDVWFYGQSQIRFAHGKIVSWKEDRDYPLRIARNQPVRIRPGVFGLGSTKEEVREIQGAPILETATVWDYGPSRVFFESDRVVRWEESPVQPLRVR